VTVGLARRSGVIFDVDGTLPDTNYLHVAAAGARQKAVELSTAVKEQTPAGAGCSCHARVGGHA
jgi:beta-phosphoglucomutase-like phosphatase (HAD superfamily)